MEIPGAAAAAAPEAAQADGGEARVANGEAAPLFSREVVQRDIARSVINAFGLRPFHVFDGERYHVGFGVAKELMDAVDYGVEDLDDFFSNCRRSPPVSNAHEGVFRRPRTPPRTPSAALPTLVTKEEEPSAQQREENECISARSPSPREVYYIMEEHYLSSSPTPREVDVNADDEPLVENQPTAEIQPDLENQPAAENEAAVVEANHQVHFINPRTMQEIHFVMEDNYLSPEELRLAVCFPLLNAPPAEPDEALPSAPNDALMDEPPPCEAAPSIDRANCGNVAPSIDRASGGNAAPSTDRADDGNPAETSMRSNAGKVRDDKNEKVSRPKRKKTKVVEEFDASQSVRLDKPSTVKPSVRKRKQPQKKAVKEFSEEWDEPPWNGLNVGDLEEQIGDSWVEGEKRRGVVEENPGDVVNPGQLKKSFWPTPLYGSSLGIPVKPSPTLIEKDILVSTFTGSDEESSEVEDFEEAMEQSTKREEVALAKYALLFKDDQSWRKKFLDGFKLTCDICFSKRKMNIFPSVMSLLAHAQEIKKLRQPEHRGYAQAIRNLLHLDEPGNAPACHSAAGEQAFPIEGVWPPVVVLENTLLGVDIDGSPISLNSSELMHMLRALGDHGKRRLHPVLKENVSTGQILVEFPATHRGWIDANHMHRQFELHARSYEDWLRLKPKFKALLWDATEVQESSGLLAVLEDKESVKRILYGYLATPHVIKHLDPNKEYVNWEVENLREFFDVSESDCSQAVQT